MRVSVFVACAAVVSASGLRRIHEAVPVPKGWMEVEEAVDKAAVLKVTVGLKRQNGDRLRRLVDAVSDPQGQDYLNYPTYEEIGNLVRPSAANTKAVTEWLTAGGVTVTRTHPHGDYIHGEATVGALEKLAHGRFRVFAHAATGARIPLVSSGVSVPAEIAEAIDTFSGFHGFPLAAEAAAREPQAGVQVNPALIRKAYNISAVARTKENIQAIGQFQGQYVRGQDLETFCQQFDNGADCKISKYIGENKLKPGVESMLDTEYLMAVGDKATTWVYSYPSLDFCSDLLTFGSDVTGSATHPTTMSLSYGSQKIDFCERSLMDRFSQDVQKMGAMGITVVIASGDDGSGGETRQGSNGGKLSPSYPASVPYCLAVGSTFFVSGASGAEEATTEFGSGGGFSYDFDLPSYQAEAVNRYRNNVKAPNAQYANGRGSPDVSLLGENFAVVDMGRTLEVAGTSASTPTFAAIITLLNDACLAASGKTLGFVNPLFYQNPQMFTDITRGTNAIGENGMAGWQAIAGWDAATGLGTPDFGVMLARVRASCAAAAARRQ